MLPGDADVVAGLIRLAFASIPVPLDSAPSALRETPDSIRDHLAAGGGAVVEDALGCILWSERDGGLYIGRLCVHPAQQGWGLAGLLVGTAEAEARRLGLAGLVRNDRDGSVEVQVQGPAASVDRMLEWLRHGPPSAHVDTLHVEDMPDRGGDGFRIE